MLEALENHQELGNNSEGFCAEIYRAGRTPNPPTGGSASKAGPAFENSPRKWFTKQRRNATAAVGMGSESANRRRAGERPACSLEVINNTHSPAEGE